MKREVKIGIISVVALAAISTSVYASVTSVTKKNTPIEKHEDKPKKVEVTSQVKKEPAEEKKVEQPAEPAAVKQEVTTPEPTPVPEKAPTPAPKPVKKIPTYEQLLAKYNIIDYYKVDFDELRAEYPERFNEKWIENTFAYIMQLYINPHAARVNIERSGWEVGRSTFPKPGSY